MVYGMKKGFIFLFLKNDYLKMNKDASSTLGSLVWYQTDQTLQTK